MKSKFLITALFGVLIGMFCSCGKDDVSVNGISINESNLTLKKGETTALVATITPEDATNKNVIWSSSDEAIATVNPSGFVSTLKAGVVTITVKSEDAALSASCKINVIVDAEGISLNEKKLLLIKGEKVKLTATINPEDATNKNVIWSSSDESIATVSQNGDVVTKKIGKVIINAKSSDKNNIQENCEITISSSDNIQYNPYGDKQQW